MPRHFQRHASVRKEGESMILILYAIGTPLVIWGWSSRGPDGKRPGSGVAMLTTGIVFVAIATLWLLVLEQTEVAYYE